MEEESEMNKSIKDRTVWWMIASITVNVFVIVELVAITIVAYVLNIQGFRLGFFCGGAMLTLYVSYALCRFCRRNHKAYVRLMEAYAHKKFALHVFHSLLPKCNDVVKQALAMPQRNSESAMLKSRPMPHATRCVDCKLIETIIDILADDPSKRMFE